MESGGCWALGFIVSQWWARSSVGSQSESVRVRLTHTLIIHLQAREHDSRLHLCRNCALFPVSQILSSLNVNVSRQESVTVPYSLFCSPTFLLFCMYVEKMWHVLYDPNICIDIPSVECIQCTHALLPRDQIVVTGMDNEGRCRVAALVNLRQRTDRSDCFCCRFQGRKSASRIQPTEEYVQRTTVPIHIQRQPTTWIAAC